MGIENIEELTGTEDRPEGEPLNEPDPSPAPDDDSDDEEDES